MSFAYGKWGLALAEQRARELGCQGTHQNNGLWMPCRDEQDVHHKLRQQ